MLKPTQSEVISKSIERLDAVLRDLHEKENSLDMLIQQKLDEIVQQKEIAVEQHESEIQALKNELRKKYTKILEEKIHVLEMEKNSLSSLQTKFSALAV